MNNFQINIVDILRLLRLRQWIKNGVVFLAMIFGGKLFCGQCWISTLLAAFCFCLASSAIYCLNDVVDVKYDREDEEKKSRPVASGKISQSFALVLGACLGVISMILSWLFLPCNCTVIIAVYLAMNICYCLGLKQIMLLDVVIIALGFVLRVIMGGEADDIWISQWIVIMVFLLALFLAFAKRRHEVMLVLSAKKEVGRKSVADYSVPFLDSTLSLLGAVLIIGYIIYTLQPAKTGGCISEYLYVTALPVLVGVLRYLQLTIVENRSGNPAKTATKDPAMVFCCVAWLGLFIFFLYA